MEAPTADDLGKHVTQRRRAMKPVQMNGKSHRSLVIVLYWTARGESRRDTQLRQKRGVFLRVG